MSKKFAAALAYAAAGLPVFPCNGKKPLPGTHGFKDATTDPAQIERWWSSGDWNIGLEPERAGWAVVDVDKGGDASAFPMTYTVTTPSGGCHLYYRGSMPSTVRKLAPGVDTRGRDGYVLVPPSVIDGREYAGSFPPDDWETVDLPAEISDRLQPIDHREADRLQPVDKPLAIEEARRFLSREPRPVEGAGSDHRSYQVAAKLVRDYALSAETCAGLMREWSGFDADWIEEKIAHALDYGQNGIGSDVPRSGAETFGASVEATHSVQIVRGGGKPKRIDWLWYEWLPRGKLTIFGGEKGVGKSTLTYHVLATITRGGNWPDGTKAPVGDILIWSAEDDWDDTILPRLMVAGADFEHVYRVDGVKLPDGQKRQFDPASDMRGLFDAALAIPNLAAVLIDPIVSAVAGDSHKNAETRRGLQPLVDFAGERHAALIGITHFSKNTQGKAPIERLNGSLAFGAVSRMVWGAVKSEDESAIRRFVRVAANISKMGGAFDYTLNQRPVPGEEADFTAQAINWGVFTDGDARALIGEVQGDGKASACQAEEFLLRLLDNDAVIEADDMRKAARAHDLSEITLKRARQKLRVICFRRTGAGPAVWCYRLPPRWGEIEY